MHPIYLMGVSSERDAESSSETKIGNLELSVLVNQQILGLHIAVKNSVRVQIVNAAHHLTTAGLVTHLKA